VGPCNPDAVEAWLTSARANQRTAALAFRGNQVRNPETPFTLNPKS